MLKQGERCKENGHADLHMLYYKGLDDLEEGSQQLPEFEDAVEADFEFNSSEYNTVTWLAQ